MGIPKKHSQKFGNSQKQSNSPAFTSPSSSSSCRPPACRRDEVYLYRLERPPTRAPAWAVTSPSWPEDPCRQHVLVLPRDEVPERVHGMSRGARGRCPSATGRRPSASRSPPPPRHRPAHLPITVVLMQDRRGWTHYQFAAGLRSRSSETVVHDIHLALNNRIPTRLIRLIGLFLLLLLTLPPLLLRSERISKLLLLNTRLNTARPIVIWHLERGVEEHGNCKTVRAYQRAVTVATRAPEEQWSIFDAMWKDPAIVCMLQCANDIRVK